MKEGQEGGDIVVNGRGAGAGNGNGNGNGEPQYSTARVLPQDQTQKTPLSPQAHPRSSPPQEPHTSPSRSHELVV